MEWGPIVAVMVPMCGAAVAVVRSMTQLETKLSSIDDRLKLITQQHEAETLRQQKQLDDHEARLRNLEKSIGKGSL